MRFLDPLCKILHECQRQPLASAEAKHHSFAFWLVGIIVHANIQKPHWSGNFWVFWKVSYIKWCFAETDTGERMSCWSRHMKECFAEADTGERMFCWSRYMRGCMMLKNIYINETIDSGSRLPHWFALLCFASLCWQGFDLGSHHILLIIFVCHNFVEINSPKKFWWCSSGFLLLPQIWTY